MAQLDESALTDWILRQLGAPQVEVQLTECQIADAIQDAKDWFAGRKGFEGEQYMAVVSGPSFEITLPDEISVVTDVVFEEYAGLPELTYPSNFYPQTYRPVGLGPFGGNGGDLSAVVQSLQVQEMSDRIFSREPDWKQDGRLLRLYALPPECSKVLVRYHSLTFRTERLSIRDAQLVRRMALAKAMLILQRVRGVLESGFQGSQGSVQFNLSVIDPAAEIEALESEIATSALPSSIIVG